MTATLTFHDEFNNLSLWNGTTGTWSTTTAFVDPNGNGSSIPGNAEQEWYINSNYAPTASVTPWTVANGILTLTAKPVDPSIAQYLGYTTPGLPGLGSYQYTSGLIETNHSFSQTYGYFEMKAQLPAGQGLWPAFWLMPQDGSWPPELDVMEALGKDPSTVYTSVHTLETGVHTSEGLAENVGNFSTGYHTYAVDWEADKITFFIDQKEVYQVDTPADMNKPMYMIANLAMGGGWAGSVDATTPWPAQMNIDYIRAYNSDPYANGGTVDETTGQPIAPGTTAPTPATSTPVPTPAPTPAPTDPVTSGATGDETLSAPVAGGTETGGSGNDVIVGGGAGANYLRGGAGDDHIQGGAGFDNVNGNQGDDTIDGGAWGNDWLLGGQGNDQITTHAGDAFINANMGNDTVQGGAGNETIHGGQGDDLINAGAGNDWISGDLGHDTLAGGAGADTFHFATGQAVEVVSDFNFAEGDRVQIDPGATYTVSQAGADVHVDFTGGGELVLQNTQLSALGSGWVFGG